MNWLVPGARSALRSFAPDLNYKIALPFRLRYRKPKAAGTIGQLIAPPIPGGTGTYTPQYGPGHWSLNFAGFTDGEIKDALSKYAKNYKQGL